MNLLVTGQNSELRMTVMIQCNSESVMVLEHAESDIYSSIAEGGNESIPMNLHVPVEKSSDCHNSTHTAT